MEVVLITRDFQFSKEDIEKDVNFLNGEGFIITSFFTNKITGLK